MGVAAIVALVHDLFIPFGVFALLGHYYGVEIGGVFVAAALGSVLPYMDSDSGIPFHVSFGTLTVVACALVFSSVYYATNGNIRAVAIWTVGTAIFVWVIIFVVTC